MKSHGLIFKTSVGVLFVVSALLSSQAASAAVKAAQYPQPVLTPAAPAGGRQRLFVADTRTVVEFLRPGICDAFFRNRSTPDA